MQSFDNQLRLAEEKAIIDGLNEKHLVTYEDREKALVRSLAVVNINLHFERVYNVIWASQITLLRFLNSYNSGATRDQLMKYYSQGKDSFPSFYVNYSDEQWLQFMVNTKLLTVNNGK